LKSFVHTVPPIVAWFLFLKEWVLSKERIRKRGRTPKKTPNNAVDITTHYTITNGLS
jgi:hypothetical protein